MIFYERHIKKAVGKGDIPKAVFKRFYHVFLSLEVTHDLGLFDIKRLKSSGKRNYFRVRKGKHRAIFFIEEDDYYVISIAKREEVYKKWE